MKKPIGVQAVDPNEVVRNNIDAETLKIIVDTPLKFYENFAQDDDTIKTHKMFAVTSVLIVELLKTCRNTFGDTMTDDLIVTTLRAYENLKQVHGDDHKSERAKEGDKAVAATAALDATKTKGSA